jgi:hypothetical protein
MSQKLGVDVELIGEEKIVKETLSRMGIANKKEKKLFPSCYLYRKEDGSFMVTHFKEVFMLTRDDAYNQISEEDIKRRNAIAFLLQEWGLVKVDENEDIEPHDIYVFSLPYKDKKSWLIDNKINVRTIPELL